MRQGVGKLIHHARSEEDVLNLLENSIALIGVYDRNEVLRYTNDAFRRAYFIDPDEEVDWQTLMRRNFASRRGTVIETDDIDGWISSVRSRRGKSRERTYESDLHDGRFIWVTETMRDDGWIVYVGTDVTQLNASERELRLARDELFRQSFTDELTGVSNRRHILNKLQDVLRSRQSGWVCILDIDHFKQINDTFGHHVGDDVLVAFAQTVRRNIGLSDAFGRIGGEEFLVIFCNQSLDEVSEILAGLRSAVGLLCAKLDYPGLDVTFSAGVSRICPDDTQSELLRRVDLGLYCAKQNGRNQVRLANGDDSLVYPLVV